MTTRPQVLCPIDFSEPSRSALFYAAALAEHFGATLTILAVDDPLLTQVAPNAGISSLADHTTAEARRFAADVVNRPGPCAMSVTFRVEVGRPATRILEVAADIGADVIVMGSHGRSGTRKLFFGSTTERVLRETTTPVLITALASVRPESLADAAAHIRRVLAPVDLSPASPHHLEAASRVARALSASLVLCHVIEPLLVPSPLRAAIPGVDGARRAACEDRLEDLMSASPLGNAVECIIVSGDPAEEIVKLARVRGAGLIVMGLHGGSLVGPRMGSVTYRVLCLADLPVLAIPPELEVAAVPQERDLAMVVL